MVWAVDGETPIFCKSDWQFVEMFWATVDNVELSHGAAAHNPCNQVFIGGITELLAVRVTMFTASMTFRHCEMP